MTDDVIHLFYRTKGSPNQPPLLILHGLWGASDNWLPVAELLSEYFYVILPDLRNHGQSPHLPEHHYQALCADIAHFIKDLHMDKKMFIAGHSMGGKVLMHLLYSHPRLVSKAAMLDIAPRAYTQEGFEHKELIDFMTRYRPEDFPSRQTLHKFIRAHYTDEAMAQLLLKNTRKTERGLAWKVNIEAIQDHFADILGWDIEQYPISTAPALFVKGACSDYITEDDASRIRHYFPAAEVATLPHSGHRLHCDQPDLLTELLVRFFLGE